MIRHNKPYGRYARWAKCKSTQQLLFIVLACCAGWAQTANTRSVSDTLPLNTLYSDSTTRGLSASPQDNTATYSDAVGLGTGRKVTADSLTYSDTAVTGSGRQALHTDTLTFSSTLVPTFGRGITTTLTESDSAATSGGSHGATPRPTDTLAVNLNFADAVTYILARNGINPVDSLTYSDSLKRGIGRLPSEQLTLTDAASHGGQHSNGPTDSIFRNGKFYDSVTALKNALAQNTISPTENFTLVDTINLGLQARPTDYLSLTTAVCSVTQGAAVSDTLGISDAVRVGNGVGRVATDALAFTDAAAKSANLNRAAVDNLSESDTVSGGGNSSVSRQVSEALVLSDGVANQQNLNTPSLADRFTLSDNAQAVVLAGSTTFTRDITITLTETDSGDRRWAGTLPVSDTLALSDSISRNGALQARATDTFTLADNVHGGTLRSLAENFSEADQTAFLQALRRLQIEFFTWSNGTLALPPAKQGLGKNTIVIQY